MRQLIILIVVALLGAAAAGPIATAAPNLEQMTDKDLETLTSERADQFPALDLFDRLAKKPVRQASVYIIEGLLYDLRYYPQLPVGAITPNLTKAIAAFQESIKAPATGVLLFGEYRKLEQQAKFAQSQDILPLGPGDKAEVMGVEDYYISAEGTWTLKEGIAFPINTVKITCFKQDKTCMEARAEIHPPESSFNKVFNLALFTSAYSIVKWEGNVVVAEKTGTCRTLTLTLDANRKEVYLIARNGTDGTGESCMGLSALDQPRITTLAGSFKTGWAHNQQQQREKELLYAPAYQEVLHTLVSILSQKGKETSSRDGAVKP